MHYTKKNKILQDARPSAKYPHLVKKLATLTYLIRELHHEATAEEIAQTLGLTKQAMEFHIKKIREEHENK